MTDIDPSVYLAEVAEQILAYVRIEQLRLRLTSEYRELLKRHDIKQLQKTPKQGVLGFFKRSDNHPSLTALPSIQIAMQDEPNDTYWLVPTIKKPKKADIASIIEMALLDPELSQMNVKSRSQAIASLVGKAATESPGQPEFSGVKLLTKKPKQLGHTYYFTI